MSRLLRIGTEVQGAGTLTSLGLRRGRGRGAISISLRPSTGVCINPEAPSATFFCLSAWVRWLSGLVCFALLQHSLCLPNQSFIGCLRFLRSFLSSFIHIVAKLIPPSPLASGFALIE
jgi:hypothetical protein